MDQQKKRNEIAKNLIDISYYPVPLEDVIHSRSQTKIPYSALAALGIGLASFAEPFRTVTQTAQFNSSGLYRIVIPSTASGTLVQKNGITLGNMVGADGHTFSGRALFAKADIDPVTMTATMPIDPTALFMTVALVSIDTKLTDIQETQKEILEFLEEDRKSKQRGNLISLTDILNQYKFNWENKTFISNMYIKVQDIKQDSVQDIDFYCGRIQRVAAKNKVSVANQVLKNKLQKLQSEFQNYQLAVYLYGFSSFLEVMLLKNFDSIFLNSIVHRIEDYSYQYRALYTECYNQLEENAEATIQKRFFDNLAALSDSAGRRIAKIPLISRSQLDDNLIRSGEQISRHNTNETQQLIRNFVSSHNSCVSSFIDSIRSVDRLYNEPIDLFFDHENLYLSV